MFTNVHFFMVAFKLTKNDIMVLHTISPFLSKPRRFLPLVRRGGFLIMFNDLEVICLSLPEDMQKLHVYALGDVHVGSQQFDEQAVRKKIKIIQDDPCGVVCLCGDLGDYGLKKQQNQCISGHDVAKSAAGVHLRSFSADR